MCSLLGSPEPHRERTSMDCPVPEDDPRISSGHASPNIVSSVAQHAKDPALFNHLQWHRICTRHSRLSPGHVPTHRDSPASWPAYHAAIGAPGLCILPQGSLEPAELDGAPLGHGGGEAVLCHGACRCGKGKTRRASIRAISSHVAASVIAMSRVFPRSRWTGSQEVAPRFGKSVLEVTTRCFPPVPLSGSGSRSS